MLRRGLLFVLVGALVGISALLVQAQNNVPEEVETALEALSDYMTTHNFNDGRMNFADSYLQIVEERDLRLSDLDGYDYAPDHALEKDICVAQGEGDSQPEQFPVPIYIVNFQVKHEDGGEITYTFHVELNGEATDCGENYASATITPTINQTRTTFTPTFTPSFTPSRTFTPMPTRTFTVTPTNTSSLTPIPSNTPTVSLTPRPDAVTCPGFLTSRLQVGEQGRVITTDPLRMREQPSTDGIQLATIPSGATFDVLQGPACDSEGRAWWRVSYRNDLGWMVEGQGEEYFTEPIVGSVAAVTLTIIPSTTVPTGKYTATPTPAPIVIATCPGFMPSRLIVGGQGRVTPGDANNVRDMPSTSGALLGQLEGGATFTVLEGPICDSQGRAWWRVERNGLIGWTPEGQNSTYYLEPVITIPNGAINLLTPRSP